MVRQRIARNVELKRQGKLRPLPKRFRPLLIIIAIAAALVIYLNKHSGQEIITTLEPSPDNNIESK